jgi:ribosomal protein S18 acetylase RimI-like enzyme
MGTAPHAFGSVGTVSSIAYGEGMTATLDAIAPSELAAIHELHHRIEAHDRIPVVMPLEEVEGWAHEPHLDLERDLRVVRIGERLAAWGRIWHQPSGVREERAYVFGAVDPELRGRGIGSTLLRWQLDRARELLMTSPAGLPRYVRARAYDFQTSAIRLYQRHGMEAVRWGDEMLRELATPVAAPALDGIAIVPWDSAHSEAARVSQNEAFADHWGSTPRDPGSWQHILDAFGTRLDLSFLALDGDRVVGVCRNSHFPGDEALNGRRDGWIDQISVIRSHRRRGIASALIVASLEAFRRAHFTHAALGVDSENPTGATALYRRLGFRTLHRAVTHQLEVR